MNRVVLSMIAMSGLAVLPIACGSSSDGGSGTAGASSGGAAHTGHDSAGSTSAGTGGGSSSVTAGAGGQSDVAPEAPMIESVEPLEGGLHVMWMNMTENCDKIVLLRSKNGGDFAVAYTLSGLADSQHDAQATAPGEYCYKAHCVKGTQTSPDSDAKCGSP